MPSTINDVDASELSVRVYYPDHSYLGDVIDYISVKSEILEFGVGTATLTVPITSPIATNTYTKNATIKSGYLWAFSEYSYDIIYKNQPWFSGPIVTADDKDVYTKGRDRAVAIDIDLGAWTWEQWLCQGRVLYGVDGGRFAPSSDKADDVLRAVLRANMLAPGSGGIEPSAYSAASVDREDFGSITVAIGADTNSHPDSVTFRWDHGEPLWDAVLEFCRKHNLKLTHTWSGSTITLDVAYPATGDDLSTGIVFDRERGNLLSLARKVDHGKVSNVAECRGQGRRELQIKGYSFDTNSIADKGVRETGEVHRSAGSTDVANGAAFLTAQWGGADVSIEAEVTEMPGCEYGDFVISDKVTVYDDARTLTYNDYITKGTLDHVAGKEVNTKFGFGRAADNANQQNSRSGGGGRGSRKGGGKPKNKDGEPVQDPDEILSLTEGSPDRGTDPVEVTVVNDAWDFKKNVGANGGDMTYPNISILGGTKKLLWGVVGTLVEKCVLPHLWWPVEFDTNGDGIPDTTYYIPTYTDTGPGTCHNRPPPGTG